MRPRPTRSRAIGALTVLLFVGAHATTLVHYASVEHVVCEAHGQVFHAGDEHAVEAGHHHDAGHHVDATDHAQVAHTAAPIGPGWNAPESTPAHAHDHCDLDDAQRPDQLAVACAQGELDLPPPAAAALPLDGLFAGFGAQTPLLLMAPKTSPPGTGLAAV